MNWQRIITVLAFALALIEGKSTSLAQRVAYSPSLLSDVAQGGGEREVEERMRSMSLEEQIGQLIIPIIYPSSGVSQMADAARVVARCHAGGILFQKGEVYDQWLMTQHLNKTSKLPLLITADAEWGLAMRLSNTIRYPRNRALANVRDLGLITEWGRSMAEQCKTVGIHVNFAPVVDVNNNPRNPVIGTRSFGEKTQDVIDYSLAYSRGLEEGRVLSVAKHFPGHGNTALDSHKTLPTIKGSRSELEKTELAPFAAYFRAGLGGIMVGHLNVPALDKSGTPASLSYAITTQLLQQEMGFSGLIFTDGMQMQGMQQRGATPISVRALLAGNDLLLGPTDPVKAHAEILAAVQQGVLSRKQIEQHCRKVLLYKWALMGQSLQQPQLPNLSRDAFYASLNTPKALHFANELWYQSISIERDDEQLIPQSRKGDISIGVLDLNSSSKPAFVSALRKMGITPKARYTLADKNGKTYSEALEALSKCSLVYVNCYTKHSGTLAQLVEQLSAKTRVVFTLFASPYQLPSWHSALKKAKVVAVAYESNDEALRAVVARYYNVEPDDLEICRPPRGKNEGQIASNAEVVKPIRTFASLDSIVEDALRRKAFPGCQVVVLHKGETVYNRAFGTLDGSARSPRVTENTLFDIASVTKAFGTTPVIMDLVGKGKIKLTDRVDKHLPEMADSRVGSISIKDLLLHQAGLTPTINFYLQLIEPSSLTTGSYFSYAYRPDWVQIDENIWVDPNAKWRDNLVRDEKGNGFTLRFGRQFIHQSFRDTVLQKIAQTPLKTPGVYRYSDVSFILLGMIAERVSGSSLDSYLFQLIAQPMHLEHYTYDPLAHGVDIQEIAPTQAKCPLRGVVRGSVDDESAAVLGGIAGNAGVFATATDLAQVAEMIRCNGSYRGKEILPHKVVQQFVTTLGRQGRRALGFDHNTKNNAQIPSNASAGTYGHTGFTGCSVWIDPKREMVCVFLSNRTYPTRLNKKLISLKVRPRLLEAAINAIDAQSIPTT